MTGPPPPSPPIHDLVLYCTDGRLLSHRLLLAAASPLARNLLGCGAEDHLVLPDTRMEEVAALLEGIYSGKLERTATLMPLLTMLGMADMEEQGSDDGEDGDSSFLEPVLHMDIGLGALPEEPTDGCFSADYDNLASDAEIEAKALELKEKIFAECGMVSRRRQGRNTRNPSRIWRWFTKTPDFIYCKVCGVGIKNSGNTTNASSHLKRHPEQYTEFKAEAPEQQSAGPDGQEIEVKI